MAKAVRIPVTVKMRAGWDATAINAPELAQAGRGRRRRRGHGARPHRGAVVHGLLGLGSDCQRRRAAEHSRSSAAAIASSRSRWSIGCATPPSAACSSAAARCATRGSSNRRRRWPPAACRAKSRPRSAGEFLLDYVDLLLQERSDEAAGFRHVAPGQEADAPAAGARPRAVGDQQAARAELVVHQGPGQRLSPACRDQRRRVDRAAARRSFTSSSFPTATAFRLKPEATGSQSPRLRSRKLQIRSARVEAPEFTAAAPRPPNPPPHSRTRVTPMRRW